MVLTALDPNDPQPKRADFGDDYDKFRKADKAWNKREGKRRKRASGAAAPNVPLGSGPTGGAAVEAAHGAAAGATAGTAAVGAATAVPATRDRESKFN